MKCPVCALTIDNPIPSFCPRCAWDFKNDLTLNTFLSAPPEKDLTAYRRRLEIAKNNWEHLENIRKNVNTSGDVSPRQDADSMKATQTETVRPASNTDINHCGPIANTTSVFSQNVDLNAQKPLKPQKKKKKKKKQVHQATPQQTVTQKQPQPSTEKWAMANTDEYSEIIDWKKYDTQTAKRIALLRVIRSVSDRELLEMQHIIDKTRSYLKNRTKQLNKELRGHGVPTSRKNSAIERWVRKKELEVLEVERSYDVEFLYKTKNGNFFIYRKEGNKKSINPITSEKAKNILFERGFIQEIRLHFPDAIQDA